jgi:hypothetical protein
MSSTPNNLQNLSSENDGLKYLINQDSSLIVPTLDQKKKLLRIVGKPNIYSRSFDLVRIKASNFDSISSTDDFELVEVKVTKKYLKDFPKNFFFGMTQNEDLLLKELDGIFTLCLVSIHETKPCHIFLTHKDLELLIKNKRIQYQINL